ncbi:hypothetical protein HDU96_008336 [Phlyctochytrium bullatum]|nr:hypothetical protein HDU96_008336 [Phlyctochytrium bullatum]
MQVGYKILKGLVKYKHALELQSRLVALKQERRASFPNIILFLQHEPVFTAGRRLRDLKETETTLRATGADYHEITFHGPGQLIAYPILDLKEVKVGEEPCYLKDYAFFTLVECTSNTISCSSARCEGVYKEVTSLSKEIGRNVVVDEAIQVLIPAMEDGLGSNLKDAILQDGNIEERVEVNQRHLIDKILARYSAENTIFRELLQNSNDAGATEASIHFKTSEQLLKATSSSFLDMFIKRSNPTVTSITYKNNGRPFSGEDWNRLKKIAEGNPDEQKIGFFGVGLREPIEAPNVVEFGKFLAASIAFTKCLRKVEVYVDDDRILSIDKKIGEARPLTFTKGSYNLYSPNNIFDLKSISVSKNQLEVKALVDYDKSKGKPGTEVTETAFLRTACGTCNVKLNGQLLKEMERTTKKRPPAVTDLQILFSNYDEYESSSTSASKTSIFSTLIIAPADQGKIFIGFPTHQTTGASFQLAAHLIPTVERESIDFVDRTLAVWNQDILAMGGLLSRIVFEDEMASIAALYKELTLDSQSETWLIKKATHALSCFSFRPSTPHSLVGRVHKTAFFRSAKFPLSLVSSKGVLPCASVRLPDPLITPFIKEIPILPAETIKSCSELVEELQTARLLKHLGFDDVCEELSKRVLDESEVVAFIRWWLEYRKHNATSQAEVVRISQTLLLVDPNDSKSPPRKLVDLKHYDFGKNPVFVEMIMGIIGRQFNSTSNSAKDRIVALLRGCECVVTSRGLKKPSESYLKTVTLFDDLPLVAFENQRQFSEQFLKTLGVRDHVKYLASVQDKLTDTEIGRLRLTPIFPKDEGEEKKKEETTNPVPKSRFKAQDLYAPLDNLKALGLPIISWPSKSKWRNNTDEDFGDVSNAFLRACGVKDEPSPPELARELVASPESFLAELGYDKYLQILRTIAASYFAIRQDSALLKRMKESPFLVGVRSTETDKKEKKEVDNTRMEFELARAQDIYLIDDPVMNQLFVPLGYANTWQSIGKIIFKKCRLNDSLLLSTLLSTSLTNLKRKGFPVDRILNLQESKLKEAAIKAAVKNSPSLTPPQIRSNQTPQTPDDSSTKAQSNEKTPLESALNGLFPDADPQFLQKMIRGNEKNPNALETISNRLLDEGYPKKPPALDGASLKPGKKEEPVVTPAGTQLKAPGGWPETSDPEVSKQSSTKNSNSSDDMFQTITRLADNVRNNWLPDLWSGAKATTTQPVDRVSTTSGGEQAMSEITPQHTENLKRQLSQAVSSVKQAKEANIRAEVPFEPDPPPARYVAPACKVLSDNELALRGHVQEIPLYLDKAVGTEGEAILGDSEPLRNFASLLRFIASVFELKASSVNIYYDKSGSTVAFNRDRTLFFNLRFYLGLHFKRGRADISETYYYWFMTFCHELVCFSRGFIDIR